MNSKENVFTNLGIAPGNRVILSMDGGGMRGIFSLQLLKKLEEVAGAPCHTWCDMVAGTSTGAIIAGLVSMGYTAAEIEGFYEKLVAKVFTKRNFLSDRFLNPPKFDKENYRELLKEIIGNITLKEACEKTGTDIMISAKDMAAGEETFFTCFDNDKFIGYYQDALLRAAMEATMSAPTYFCPLERFVDGGTTTFNNPAAAALLEAVCYGGKGKYVADKVTLLSFGTATALRFVDPQHNENHGPFELKFWLNYVMDETSKDASDMQIDWLRSGLIQGLDFRRFQLSLDRGALNKIPDRQFPSTKGVNGTWLGKLSDQELQQIDMADYSKFELMRSIGMAVAEHICPPTETALPMAERTANWFQRDLLTADGKRDELITAFGDKAIILSHMRNPEWLDQQATT